MPGTSAKAMASAGSRPATASSAWSPTGVRCWWAWPMRNCAPSCPECSSLETVALGQRRMPVAGRRATELDGRAQAPVAALHLHHHLAVQGVGRSEEHTSELQSPCNLVCRLLLEKK